MVGLQTRQQLLVPPCTTQPQARLMIQGQIRPLLQSTPTAQALMLFRGKTIRHPRDVVRHRAFAVVSTTKGLGHF